MADKPPIAPVLEKYNWDGRMSGRGPWYRVNCPFHSDRHASASLNEDEQVFTCHAGCDISGDAYAIVMKVEGCGFTEAKAKVKEITGVDNDDDSRGARGARSKLPLWTRTRANSAGRPGRRLSGHR